MISSPYRPRPVEHDEELGPVRYCPGCDEWWPDDEEFWIVSPPHEVGEVGRYRDRTYIRRTPSQKILCRACHYERKRRWNERNDVDPERRERRLRQMRESARRYRVRRREAAS
jgi:hypothetical protein